MSGILVVAQVFPPRPGGTGRWAWELYRRLRASRVVFAAGHAEGDRAFDADTDASIERIPLDFKSWGLLSPSAVEYFRTWRRLHRVAQQRELSDVHCAKALPEGLLGLGLKKALGLRMWCYAHGEELRLASMSRELRVLSQTVLRGADHVIANSEFTRSVLLNEWAVPHERVIVMSPGVDTDRFRPAPLDPTIRRQLGWADKRVILTIGTMQKRKGQDTVIRALPAIRRDCPNVLYVVAGSGLERPYLGMLAQELGVSDLVQFRTAPPDAELPLLYQQCDVFAMPNRQIGWDVEGFGIVLLEAQACARPVVAGRSGGTVDAVVDSVTGLLVDGESPDKVAIAITKLLNSSDLSATMGARGRERVVARFDWNSLVRDASLRFSPSAASDKTALAQPARIG